MDQASAPLLSLEEAQERLLGAVPGPLGVEEVPLAAALGRVLAAPVRSTTDLPPWDNASMDGFAVRATDVAAATISEPVRLQVVDDARAGSAARSALTPGCAIRIATGAPLPAGADAVVPVEDTIVESPAGSDQSAGRASRSTGFAAGEPLPDSCLVAVPVQRWDSVRRRGEDVSAGSQLLVAGTEIRPPQVAMAAAVGARMLTVHRQPIVAVLSTGDELRGPGQELGDSGIPDANRPGLLALATEAGARPLDLGIATDSIESVLPAVKRGVELADVVITSGGVSVGPFDVVRAAFEAVGHVEMWKVAIQPGKPFAFGRAQLRASDGKRVLLFGLPGNPVSAQVTFHLFVRPALDRLAGLPDRFVDADLAITEERLTKAHGRRGFLRVTVARDQRGSPARDDSGRLRVRLAGGQGSHVLSALATADALAVVPESVDELPAGSDVEIRWLRR